MTSVCFDITWILNEDTLSNFIVSMNNMDDSTTKFRIGVVKFFYKEPHVTRVTPYFKARCLRCSFNLHHQYIPFMRL